jgi:hypothetical protein
MRYKITTLFSVPDYYELRFRLFGDAQPNFEQFTPNGSEFVIGFATPQTPADLGPLVKVELVSE